MSYDHREVEKKAQEKWSELGLYQTDLSDTSKEPFYLLVEFPYPSGDLHIGHWYAFAVTDIYARMLRARGKNVLFPIGFDAFGLPAENAAIKNGVNPKEWTYANIERMRKQLRSMGPSFDWSKEVVACDPSYYQWTQWLFTKLFEHGLAEHREAAVKWCPKDQTVLANEQVVDGCCERCGTAVEEKRLTQWFLRITQYADRLLKGLDALPWREEIKDAQRAWIGKSEGAKLQFPISNFQFSIEVFTTRPDTIYGATYVVLAPEHSLIQNKELGIRNYEEVQEYIKKTSKKTERERSENKEKTGVKLEGVSAINPATKEEIPVYIADYVLSSYGTGAVMAVPAHDERDMEFAKKFGLPVRQVISPVLTQTTGSATFHENEPAEESFGIIALVKHWSEDKYIGLRWPNAGWGTLLTGGIDDGLSPKETVLKEIREETGYTDARIVRQLGVIHSRYFHEPKKLNRFGHAPAFLVELASDASVPVSDAEKEKHEVQWHTREELRSFLTANSHLVALDLYEERAYTGDGILANSGEFDGKGNREAMWDIVAAVGGERTTQYRLRDWLVSRQRYWGCPIPIVYDPEGKPHTIPAEHLPWLLPTDADFTPTGKSPLASSNELRERVVKLFGEGWTPEYDTLDTFVDSSWYFLRYLDPKDSHNFSDASLMKKWLPINRYSGGSEHTTMHVLYARFFMKALYDLALVPVEEPFTERFNRGLIMGPDGAKMSKSKGNVVNPDEFVEKYGADAVRLYLAFIGPYNEPGSYPWNLEGVASMRKFLDRVERLVEKHAAVQSSESVAGEPLLRALAKASLKAAEDGDRFKFNTGIAALMALMNELESTASIPATILQQFVVILAPFAPHLAEHLWARLDGEGSVHEQAWPLFDDSVLASNTTEIIVQVNGKRRGSIMLAVSGTEKEAVNAAKAVPAVVAALCGKEPKRVIYVAGKILNFVV
ncbi:MAG: class I tRNA ligase family protein [Candidatus Pacebacteria bacterium]|nr:class I tRNA ligase family protein [Candidatus Paceibacterota bacterium]